MNKETGLEGWNQREDEDIHEFFTRIAIEAEEKPPWTNQQQVSWEEFIIDLAKKENKKENEKILERANNKDYHDFESECILPKGEMAKDLRQAGYLDMLNKLLHGSYHF